MGTFFSTIRSQLPELPFVTTAPPRISLARLQRDFQGHAGSPNGFDFYGCLSELQEKRQSWLKTGREKRSLSRVGG
jgi:hypothetical protein